MRLLVVDDDAVFREEFTAYLEELGHEVASAPSAVKAIEAIDSGDGAGFDVVFTDLRMPRETGMDLLRELHARRPDLFVIMVTGYATVPTAVEAMKLGAWDYITKPFRTDQVRRALELVAEELRFKSAPGGEADPAEVAGHLARARHLPVLLATRTPTPAHEGVYPFAFDGASPNLLTDELARFLHEHPEGALVIAHTEEMLKGHRREDILAVVADLRGRLAGRGPLVLGLTRSKVSDPEAEALRSAVTAPFVHGAIDALSNPIRRRVLRRLVDGPATFSEVMRSAELDDSPKLSFHLHRLEEEGLLAHVGDSYRLTEKGNGAVSVLRELESVGSGPTMSSFVFTAAERPRR